MKYESKQPGPQSISDRYLDDFIGIELLKEDAAEKEERKKNHKSSGKLSAGKLSWPLQWQILHRLGIQGKDADEYGIRKMLRGKHCEDWFISKVPGIVCKQEFREYRGVIGYEDTSIDTASWNNPVGVIPVEIKSVANAKFKRIVDQGADLSHIYQNTLYALANNKEKLAIAYIAADDYRVKVFIYNTIDFKGKVDEIIDRYEKQGLVVPVFVPEEKWQANPIYNSFPEWSDLNEEQIKEKLLQIQNGRITDTKK